VVSGHHRKSDKCFPPCLTSQDEQQPTPPAPPHSCSFPSNEYYKGSGAVVQMESVEQAGTAIHSLNGITPPGGTTRLLVRFADSPAEKAAKAARRETLGAPRAGGGFFGLASTASATVTPLQEQVQRRLWELVSGCVCVFLCV
jgi:hypothetical protein